MSAYIRSQKATLSKPSSGSRLDGGAVFTGALGTAVGLPETRAAAGPLKEQLWGLSPIPLSLQLTRAFLASAIGAAVGRTVDRCTGGKDWTNARNVALFLSASCPEVTSISTLSGGSRSEVFIRLSGPARSAPRSSKSIRPMKNLTSLQFQAAGAW